MAPFKLLLAGLSPDEKVQLATRIHSAMSGNANFPEPAPPLASIVAAARDLARAVTKCAWIQRQSIFHGNAGLEPSGAMAKAAEIRQQTRIAAIEQDSSEDRLDAVLTQLATYVGNASGGDDAVILTAGMAVTAAARAL